MKLLTIIVAIACFVMALCASACAVDDAHAKRILNGAGYTHVMLRGYAWFGCGQDDAFNTEFSAIGPTGHVVTGVVCCGAFKSCTVRVD